MSTIVLIRCLTILVKSLYFVSFGLKLTVEFFCYQMRYALLAKKEYGAYS